MRWADGPRPVVQAALHDIRYAARLLVRQPGSALIASLTIALAVAATTTLFSVVYGVLARPLPWPAADRLAHVVEMREGSPSRFGPILTNAAYLAWEGSASTIDGLAAESPRSVTLTGLGTAERVRTSAVTASLFPLLEATPLLGRTLRPDDEPAGAPRVIVLSHGFWRDRLGAAPDALGRALRLDGAPYTIVGVMPAGFVYPDDTVRAWTAFQVPPVTGDGSLSMFSALARLRPGVTPAQAAAEATARVRSLPDAGLTALAVFGRTGPPEIAVVPAIEMLTREVRPALLVLLAAVGLLLLAAIGNVAAVQLARAARRRRELAIRSAMGARPGRLAGQWIAESLVIGTAGGAAGLLLAALLHRTLPAMLAPDFPRLDAIAFDWRVAAFSLAAGLGSAVLSGVLPALQARRVDVTGILAEDGLAPVGGSLRTRTSRLRAALVMAQIAVATALVVSAALLAQSFAGLLRADRGYDPDGVLTATLPMPASLYTPARRQAILETIVERLRDVPGVASAGFTSILPLSGSESMRAFTMAARDPADPPVTIQSAFRVVSPGYFPAMGMRMAEGRPLADADTSDSRPVVVINRTFARQVFEGSPIGRTLPLGSGDRAWEVVGVAEDVRTGMGSGDAQPEMFVSYRQWEEGLAVGVPALVVRVAGRPAQFASHVRTAVREQDETLAIGSLASMDERVRESLGQPRLYAALLAGFALAALVVAAVGLFGALAYSVAERRREIGVRAALGASPADLVRLVVGQGLVIATGGVLVGWAVALASTRVLGSLLYGVEARDPLTFAAGGAALLAAAAIACAVPARRAARLDPLIALRR